MAEKREYTEFRSLLKEAMGNKSQKEFAEMTGLSSEHLNRMLNQALIARPSEQTLQKIVQAVPMLDARALYSSCGYEPRGRIMMDLAKMSLTDVMRMVATKLKMGFSLMVQEMRCWPSLDDVLREYRSRYGWELFNIQVSNDTWKQNMDEFHKGYYSVFCVAHWMKSNGLLTYHKGETFFMLYFMKLDNGMYFLTDVAIDGRTLSLYGNLPEYLKEMVYEDGEDMTSFPYCCVTTEKQRPENSGLVKLQNAIFGRREETELYSMQYGLGAVYEGTPARFVDYVLENQDYFGFSAREQEIMDNLSDIQAGTSSFTPEQATEGFYFDGTEGPGAILTAILHRKFGKPAADRDFVFDVDYGESAQYTDYLKPCIFIREEYYTAYGKMDKGRYEYLKKLLGEEFRKMGLPTIGGVLVYDTFGVDLNGVADEQEPLSDLDKLAVDDMLS